jgi:serine protease inhibitor
LLPTRPYRKVNLYFPKFKIENKLRLLSQLKKMGLGILANPPNFDLSEFYETQENIVVKDVLQGNFFQVDEKGIEAASATAVMKKMGGVAVPEKPLVLNFNRPFVFLIYQKMTGRLVFLGQVHNPIR